MMLGDPERVMKEATSILKPLISVIIVVKNDRGIAQTLKGLKEGKFDQSYEVIVVDASAPEALADIKKQNSWVIWDQYPVSKKRTTPQQRNRGLELAKGVIVAFIDANCEPTTKWLSSIAKVIESGEDIVCGPVNDLNKNNLVHYAAAQKEGYVDECTTINVGLRRTVFERVGNFDERFLFGQDVDFFWRTADAGFKIYFNPKMAIGHNWGDRKEQLVRAFNYGRARAQLFKKHWRLHGRQLLRGEPHVWVYPVFILGLSLTLIIPFYPLLLLVPLLKNRSSNPLGLVLHHLVFGCGVLVGAISRL